MKENLGLRGRRNTLVPLQTIQKMGRMEPPMLGRRACPPLQPHLSGIGKEESREEAFERYHKFCVVRNPWDRAVSQFFFEKHGEGMPGLPEDLAFSDYLTTLPDAKLSDSWLYTIGGSLAVDRVLRYENWQRIGLICLFHSDSITWICLGRSRKLGGQRSITHTSTMSLR